jgi:hypothetical protein
MVMDRLRLALSGMVHGAARGKEIEMIQRLGHGDERT